MWRRTFPWGLDLNMDAYLFAADLDFVLALIFRRGGADAARK
jgi:hypothetical protein